ncbi:DUF7010 family protein [Thalassotalea sediminis]|uniref:DUF7010 family protein n=1 Tax=Thalassotalea sediminis TaxID=1759089 RepID=UPI00257374F7|nr:hypothetical protein [Thalassotalea sediminis]
MSLDTLRTTFEQETNRSISMPLSGAFVWLIVAILSTQFSEKTGLLILLFGSGTIFPIALLIAKYRHEAITSSKNPLAKLMGMCALMVNLLWAVHIPLFIYAPEFITLSIGIGLGLHWVVYSWIIQHPLGLIHSILRTLLIVIVWYLFPEDRLFAVGITIVLVYMLSIYQMLTRKIEL